MQPNTPREEVAAYLLWGPGHNPQNWGVGNVGHNTEAKRWAREAMERDVPDIERDFRYVFPLEEVYWADLNQSIQGHFASLDALLASIAQVENVYRASSQGIVPHGDNIFCFGINPQSRVVAILSHAAQPNVCSWMILRYFHQHGQAYNAYLAHLQSCWLDTQFIANQGIPLPQNQQAVIQQYWAALQPQQQQIIQQALH